jgi:hypothetical protein
LAKSYMWFVVVLAGLAGVARVLLPRRLAELQIERFRAPNALVKHRKRSVLFLVMGVIFGTFYFTRWGHQSWMAVGAIFPLLGGAETYFQARFPTLDPLIFQSRLLGILYLGLAAASYVILTRT